MCRVADLFLVLLPCNFFILVLANSQKSYSIYETPEAIKANGYPAERHTVVTEDGYILELHRIPAGKGEEVGGSRPVVFLMHGLLGASDGFIFPGPEYGVAYNFADAGFDVWMGNARGNRLSRKHISLDPDEPNEKYKFFNFSFEEIGKYDLAASVDYILKLTGREDLHYIGHSQGGTVFLVLNSLRPEYNRKFKSAHLLAGVGYQKYLADKKLRFLSIFTDTIYSLAVNLGLVELFPPSSTKLMDEISEIPNATHPSDMCAGNLELRYVCERFGLNEIMDDNRPEMAGAALKQIAHYGQNLRDRMFLRYNHGALRNLKEYGTVIPPKYDLSLITTSVMMHYTTADKLLKERDVLDMAADMPNAQVRRVAKDGFKHGDFITSTHAKELVTEYIIHAINVVKTTG